MPGHAAAAAAKQPLPADVARTLFAQVPRLQIDEQFGIALGATPTAEQLHAMRSLDIGLVVDLNPYRSRDAAVLGGAPRYAWLRCRDYLPGRAAAEHLEQLRTGVDGMTFVYDDDADRAAALLAAHAFWVRGRSVDEALALAMRLGLDAGLEPGLRARLVR